MRRRTASSPSPGGTRQSIRICARDGMTLILLEALVIVGVSVTPNIGSTSVRSRGSSASIRASAAAGSSGVLAQPAQHRRGRLGELEALRLFGQRGEHRGELEQRVVAGARHRGVAGGPEGGDVEAEDPLLGAADAVVAPAAVLEHLAGALVEQEVAADLVGMGLGQPVRADLAPGLLVGDEHELQRARAGRQPVPGQAGGGHRLGGDLVLHVQRAPAPQEAVGHFARPRVVAPLRGVGQHRVDVAEQDQHRPAPRPGRRGSPPGWGAPGRRRGSRCQSRPR